MSRLESSSLTRDLGDLDSAEIEMLQLLAAAPSRHSHETVGLGPGSVLTEHLTIERHLGSGAMGTVFLAHDSRLQRHVAIKVHLRTGDREVAKAEREARALARISHPNVLAIHEVGRIGPRLFVATEYVEGETAETWMRTDHGWRRVVEVFAAAGEGLAAAHEAGLIHRDFKPSNVLIGRDGRVRVADFGLARPSTDGRVRPSPSMLTDAAATRDSGEQTRAETASMTQRVAGTPAYMAPEQFEGHPSARADQFSFCIALAEALTGARPYGDHPSHAATPADFSLARGPRGRPPRRLVKLLRKGAALDPEDRFASMHDLVIELRRSLSPRQHLAVAGALVLASLSLGTMWLVGQDDAQLCAGADERVTEVWNEARAAELEAAFASAHPSAGAGAWAPLPARIDAYLDAWTREREASCRATHVTGTQPERALEQSMACFDRRLAELDATLRALARVEGSAVSEAWRAIPDRSELASCRDMSELAAWAEGSALNPEYAADLAYARTLQILGKVELAREELARLTARAEQTRDEPARLRAEFGQARALLDAGEVETAERLVETNYWAARRSGLEREERQAALLMATIEILRRREPAAARVWLRLSSELGGASRLSDDAVWLDALVLQEEGEPEAAIELLVAALDQLDDDEVEARLRLLDGLNTAYDASGQPQKALETIDSALALTSSLSGEYGSVVWPLLSNRGLMLDRLARHEESIAAHRQAIALAEALHGRSFVDAHGISLNLALALSNQGDYEAALELLPDILESTRARFGDEHPDVALVLEVRGYALRSVGRVEESLADFHAALAIARASLDPSHPDVARYLQHIARSSRLLGRREAEAEAAVAAVRAYEAAGQADYARTRVARLEAAEVSLALERFDVGFDHADHAVDPTDPPEHLRAVWRLAREHLDGPPAASTRARFLAEGVAEAAAEAGQADLSAEIEDALAN
jgi:tetratricopeptide (TPR) repeat protein